jgi:hypothetical protein
VNEQNRGNENAESLVIEDFRETGVLDGRLENSRRSVVAETKSPKTPAEDTLKVAERNERASEGFGRKHHERRLWVSRSSRREEETWRRET